MEWLEAAGEYERDPICGGLSELLNQWEDWAGAAPTLASFPRPIYTETEAELLLKVAAMWGAFCSAVPQTPTAEREALRLPQWLALLGAARAALEAMRCRGRLSETFEDE